MTRTESDLLSLLALFYPAAFVLCTAEGNLLVLRG